MSGDELEPGVIANEIVSPDGRYLIFYTFDDGDADADTSR